MSLVKKLTVGELIAALQKLPQDATVHAYEGEVIGIVVEAKGNNAYEEELAFFETPC